MSFYEFKDCIQWIESESDVFQINNYEKIYVYTNADNSFNLCESGGISDTKLDELLYVSSIMEKEKKFFEVYSEPKSISQNGPRSMIISGDELLRGILDNKESENLKKINERLELMDTSELSAIEMGLCFVRDPSTIPDLDCFKKKSIDQKKQSILQMGHLFNRSFGNLNKHIELIKKYLNIPSK